MGFPRHIAKGVLIMDSIKKYKTGAIILSVLTIALGVVMIIWPDISALTACYLTGAICIAMGIYELVRYFELGLAGVLFRFDLGIGIFSILAGVILICHPMGAMTVLPIILGVYIIISGIFSIQTSTELRVFGYSSWWTSLVLGIIGVLLGVFMIFDPFTGAAALMIYIGISLLVTGIQSIYTIICLSKAFKCDGHQKIIDAVWHECD